MACERAIGQYVRELHGLEVRTHVDFGLVKDDQTAGTLVEDAVEDLVEDHLTQPAVQYASIPATRPRTVASRTKRKR